MALAKSTSPPDIYNIRNKKLARPSKCPQFYTYMISGEKNLRQKKYVNFVKIEIATKCRNFYSIH